MPSDFLKIINPPHNLCYQTLVETRLSQAPVWFTRPTFLSIVSCQEETDKDTVKSGGANGRPQHFAESREGFQGRETT